MSVREIHPQENPNYQKTWAAAADDWYSNTPDAIFRVPSWIAKFSRLFNATRVEFGKSRIHALDGVAHTADTVWQHTIWFRVSNVRRDVLKAYKAWKAPSPIPGGDTRNAQELVRATADATFVYSTCLGSIVSFFSKTATAPIRIFGEVADATETLTSLTMAGKDALETQRALSQLKLGTPDNIKTHLKQTANVHWLAVAKGVCSAAGAVFGIIALATGVTPVAAVVSLSLALLSVTFAIGKTLYANTMEHKEVAWFDPSHITFVPRTV